MKQYTPAELQHLYQVARNVEWRYRLDGYEDAALKDILRTLKKAQAECVTKLGAWMATQFQVERAEALLAEFDSLTLAMRQQLSGDIRDTAATAGQWAVDEYVSITSFGGLVANFNNIALSADQFKSFFDTTPLGGKLLTGWVDSAFDSTAKAGILEELRSGVLQGEGYGKLVSRVTDDFEMTNTEAVTLARTYVQTANVSAQEAVYAANADIVEKVKWCSTLENGYSATGRGTCATCASLDGKEFARDSHPPCPRHPRCLTPETPVYAPDKVAAFVAPYSGPVFEIGLSNGARFTVTPNHLFLTRNGFAPAKALRQGAQIFCDSRAQGVAFGDPDDNGKPTPIKQVVEAMAKAPGMSTVRVPLASEDLHGDGRCGNGYVDVVAPDSLLRGDHESFLAEHGGKIGLVRPDVSKVPFPCKSNPVDPLFWLRNATGCGVSGESVSEVFLRRSRMHHQPVSRGIVSDKHPGVQEALADSQPAYAKTLGNGVLGFSRRIGKRNFWQGKIYTQLGLRLTADGLYPVSFKNLRDGVNANSELLSEFSRRFSEQISFADVLFCEKRYFDGHVYDLQTLTSLYYVNGAVSSNCRCVLLPVMKSWKELGLPLEELQNAARPYTKRPDQNIDTGGKRTILEVGQHDGDYGSFWAKQGKAFQDNAIGPKRAELVRSGAVSFHDLTDDAGNLRTLEQLQKL